MENPENNEFDDILSNLPGRVIQHIMDFLPVRDAARTCVLSSKWRDVWVNHPSLVLDYKFWKKLYWRLIDDKDNYNRDIAYANTVGSILLSHLGYIREFVIDISFLDRMHKSIDFWLSCLCRKSLKVLRIVDYAKHYKCVITPYYEVPSFVFVKSELIELSIYGCSIRKAIGCFSSIRCLILEKVPIYYSVRLTTPLLTTLSMIECVSHDSTNFAFDLSAPKLASLTLENCRLKLQTFFKFKEIEYAFLSNFHGDLFANDGKHLVELFASWPKISVLVVDGHCFEELATGSIPGNDHIPSLNLSRFVLLGVNLDCEKIAWILYVLKNSPLLHTFEIRFGKEGVDDIDEPSILDLNMGELRIVKIKGFKASRNEVIFIGILLKCAPFLEKMLVEKVGDKQLDPWKELSLLQRKYPNTEIILA